MRRLCLFALGAPLAQAQRAVHTTAHIALRDAPPARPAELCGHAAGPTVPGHSGH